MRKIFSYIIIFLILILAIIGFYINYLVPESCQTSECFYQNMKECKKATYLSDEKEASWRFKIIGEDKYGNCVIEVKLIQAKEGLLELDKLAGYDMLCYREIGFSEIPYKNLDKCHGRLKEEMQSIIIKKMHTHILENIEEINSLLNKTKT